MANKSVRKQIIQQVCRKFPSITDEQFFGECRTHPSILKGQLPHHQCLLETCFSFTVTLTYITFPHDPKKCTLQKESVKCDYTMKF